MADSTAPAPSAAPAGAPGTQAPAQQSSTSTKPGETAAQTQARLIKLAIEGKEVELPESEVLANFQKGRNASQLLSKVEQRRQEALRARAEADGVLGRIKTEPLAVLRELGVDFRKLSEETILEEVRLEQMTPAERRAYEAEKQLKELRAEQEKGKKAEQEKAHAAEVERHKDEFASLFMDTMERTGLPKSSARYVVPRMAQLYAQNEAAGLESTPEEMAAHVLAGLKTEHGAVLSGLQGDALLEYLGPDTVKKVLGAHLAKIRSRGGQPVQQTAKRPDTMPRVANPDPRKGRWNDVEALIKGG